MNAEETFTRRRGSFRSQRGGFNISPKDTSTCRRQNRARNSQITPRTPEFLPPVLTWQRNVYFFTNLLMGFCGCYRSRDQLLVPSWDIYHTSLSSAPQLYHSSNPCFHTVKLQTQHGEKGDRRMIAELSWVKQWGLAQIKDSNALTVKILSLWSYFGVLRIRFSLPLLDSWKTTDLPSSTPSRL